MTHEELKALDSQHTMQTYGRFDIDLDRGQGATLWDLAGKEYIDFTSGIGVISVGHNNPKWVGAVTDQLSRLVHTSNLFYTQPYAKLSQQLCTRAGMSKVFYGNSGAESNEGMLKLARKYSFDRYGKGRGTVITLKNSFHGRTATTLMATGQDGYHNYFHPLSDGFRYGEANNLDSIQEVAGHDVCAVMIELIQGEGGVLPLEQDFVTALADLCKKRDWLLLVDEVQTGVGRTGTLFAYQQFDIQPDVVSFAKGIAGGLPFGGFMANEACSAVLTAGMHGSTFGGTPICATAALTVLDILDEEMLETVKAKGEYIRTKIQEMNLPCLGNIRGMGLMLGIEVKGEKTNKELAIALMEQGLLVLTAGPVLRFLPPLTISQEELDKGLDILKKTLGG